MSADVTPSPSSTSSTPHDAERGTSTGWVPALVGGAILFVLSFVAFVVIPDRLTTYLSEHARASVRDTVVLVWTVVAFAALSWLFVRLQPRGDT